MNDVSPEQVREAAREQFHRAVEEADWFQKLGLPDEAERAKGRAIGALELRDRLFPFANFESLKQD